MSRRGGYSDAEKAAYWRKQAQGQMSRRQPVKSGKGKSYYKYKTLENEAARKEKIANLERTKDPGVISAVGSALGGAAGSWFGGPAGGLTGGFIGSKLGHLVEKITGFGDYRIQSNSLMRGGMSQAQIVNTTTRGGVIVRHREYVGDVLATTAFTVTQYPLNPGQAVTFPWLSQGDGRAYEQWKPRGMIFEYVSTSSDAVLATSASAALGSVCMATDYDALDNPFPNKRAMLNSEFASSSKPSCNFIHPIECKMSATPTKVLYTRPTLSYPTGGDPRMYDLGHFYVATEGMQNAGAGEVVGQLYVIYEVEFFKPQISLVDAMTDHWRLSAMTSTSNLGTVQSSLAAGGTIGGVVNGAGNAYSFPAGLSAGFFMCTYEALGTTAVIGTPDITVTNGVIVDYWANGFGNFVMSPATGTNSTAMAALFLVKITSAGCIINFGTCVIPTAGVGDFWITQISSTIVA